MYLATYEYLSFLEMSEYSFIAFWSFSTLEGNTWLFPGGNENLFPE